MAKLVEPLPILRGKVARKFEKQFLTDRQPDPEKVEQIKKAIEVYRITFVIR